jgi:hypothetical protein
LLVIDAVVLFELVRAAASVACHSRYVGLNCLPSPFGVMSAVVGMMDAILLSGHTPLMIANLALLDLV